jgi:hypothetical protein
LNSSFQVGTWNGVTFSQFGATDITPITISTIASLAGRWSAGVTDNNNVTAAPFNGATIWFKASTTADGGGFAYFSGASVFPNANGGVGDSVTVSSLTLTTLGANSELGSRAYSADDGRIIVGVVPEPSSALLGAIGALGLLRRRRN